MSDQIFINILLQHNTWATRELIESARSLDYEEFTQVEFDMGLKTVHDTLLHIVGAMARWSDRLVGRELRPSPANTSTPGQISKKYYSPDEFLNLLIQADRDLKESVNSLINNQRLSEYMTFPAADGAGLQDYRFTLGAAICHIITHGVHHRAQALNMLRQLKVDKLPELDVIEWEMIN